MAEYFGKIFSFIENEHFLTDLQTMEERGCVFDILAEPDRDGFSLFRIDLSESEINEYVQALKAYDEFLGYLELGENLEDAIDRIRSDTIRDRVKKYNEWARDIGEEGGQFSPAAFYSNELEALLTGGVRERYELISPEDYGEVPEPKVDLSILGEE